MIASSYPDSSEVVETKSGEKIIFLGEFAPVSVRSNENFGAKMPQEKIEKLT
jgi:hypothetical protein